MGNRFRVDLSGDKELLAKLARLGNQVEVILEAAVTAGAEVMRDDARTKAPGPEIETETESRSRTRVTKDIGPTKEKWYYTFFETGTAAGVRTTKKGYFTFIGNNGRLVRVKSINHPGMAAKPFLRPAFDKNRGQEGGSVKKVGQKFKEAIDAASK